MILYRKDTLAYHKSRPLFQLVDLSGVPLQEASKRLNAYMDTKPVHVSPEDEALQFYLHNHAFAEIRKRFDEHEVLPAEVNGLCNTYLSIASESAMRLMYYMLMIITRESRHWKAESPTVRGGIIGKYPKVYDSFQYSLKGLGSDGAAMKIRTHAPDMPFGDYVSAVTDVFNKGSFAGGYGGKPWGVIADTLRKYVYGEISAEILMDTAWTLAHNNGPMFNKGMLYSVYQHNLLTILDVQRSGQVPQLIAQVAKSEISLANVTKSMIVKHWKGCRDVLGECFGGYVDWYKVEDLGALAKYDSFKAKQVAAYGYPPGHEPPKQKTTFYVSPTTFVYKIDREELSV